MCKCKIAHTLKLKLKLQRSGGGTGRHAGLKILFAMSECGFDSRPEYEIQFGCGVWVRRQRSNSVLVLRNSRTSHSNRYSFIVVLKILFAMSECGFPARLADTSQAGGDSRPGYEIQFECGV